MKNYLFKKKGLKMTSLNIVYDAGSRLEVKGRYGTMHLMEHLICKTFKHLYSKLSELGISWNAYTSSEQVEVFFSGLDKYLTNDLKYELYKCLSGGLSCVSEEEFESEKKVVLQEYMDYVFDSDSASTMNIIRKFWGDCGPIGEMESIVNFKHKDMLEVYEEHFRNPVKITEVGRFRTNEFAYIDYGRIYRTVTKPKYGVHDIPLVNVASDEKTSVIATAKTPVLRKDYPYLSIGMDMLTGGLESPFYRILREELGLTYFVQAGVQCYYDFGILVMKACTGTERSGELIEKMKEIICNAKDMLSRERYDVVMSAIKIGREKQDAVLYKDCYRYSTISKMKFPNSLDKITFEKVVEVTMKYLASMEVLTIND